MTATAIRKKLVLYLQVADEKKLKALYTLLEDDIKGDRVSIEQYNKELDEAMEEIKKGEVYSHAEVIKMAKSW